MSATHTLRLIDLDSNATAAEAVAKRVLLEVYRGALWASMCWSCFCLLRVQRQIKKLGHMLTQISDLSPEDRQALRGVAYKLQEAADAMYEASTALSTSRVMIHVPLRSRVQSRMERLADSLEDLAETAALGASAELADAIKHQVEGHYTDLHQREKVAI